MDARHNHPRMGRIVMGRGRDAADVAMSTAFGVANLVRFVVVTQEQAQDRLALEKPRRLRSPENTERRRPAQPRVRSVRDPKIPIGRAAPNPTAPFPTRGFLLTRLSNAGPASSSARLQRAGVRNPSALRT